jgi:NAD(P)-dependent dehydrogenase (short-subunit alcohol dehydrogenase family)
VRTLAERVVVVTGAASGIGRALACALAAEGCRLALADVDPAGLAETARIAAAGGSLTEVLDVADREAVHRFAARVRAHFGAVHVVVNNAGVTVSQAIRDTSPEDFAWLMGVNFWGVVHGTQAFLPHLMEVDEAAIVNVSSVFGLVGFPFQGAYCASKFAVRGFTEALRAELAATHVTVVCVHPGGVRTDILRKARFYADATGEVDQARAVALFEQLARTTPESAARRIVDGIRRSRPRVLIGPDARLFDLVQRLLPGHFLRALRPLVERAARVAARPVAAPIDRAAGEQPAPGVRPVR